MGDMKVLLCAKSFTGTPTETVLDEKCTKGYNLKDQLGVVIASDDRRDLVILLSNSLDKQSTMSNVKNASMEISRRKGALYLQRYRQRELVLAADLKADDGEGAQPGSPGLWRLPLEVVEEIEQHMDTKDMLNYLATFSSAVRVSGSRALLWNAS